ncbi:MAG: [acyl-carrier-protein] S-malonyltransferase [Bacteroidetes bacterium]|nr:MAG: [acyl-carrier-protein] S-malonyltransferase [Bacteroidota bacterium]
MKKALLFSGQGSQYVGMMKDISEKFPDALNFIKEADEILGYKLSEICFDGPSEKLKETRYTQPAIFFHSALILYLIKDKIDYSTTAGHSVGEYAALLAADVIKFEDALKLVSLRGELMYKAGENEPGTMFAVINLDDDKVEEVCKNLTETGDGNVIVAANYNSPGQIVVSGSAEYLRTNAGKFKDAGAKFVKELIVSGAFHSPLMEPAKKELEVAINKTNFQNSRVPIYCNVYAKPLTDANEIKGALIKQLTSPVLWTQTMKRMKNDGFDNFIEIGPGNVLQGLAKRTIEGIEISGIDKAEDLVNFKF